MIYKSKILKKDQLTHNIWSVYFEKPYGFNYIAGQYMEIDFEGRKFKDYPRNFTISSSPLDEYLTITTRWGKSDYKKKLFELDEKSEIKMDGPKGNFILDAKNDKEKVFLSGGIGITVFHSMLKFIDKEKLNMRITLIASFKKLEDIIYFDEFKKIANENKNVKIIYTLSQESIKGFEQGRIKEKLIKKYISDFKNVEFYSCGSFSFNASMEEILINMRVKLENIKYESIID